jgi:acetolactate decarboxylase
MAAAFATLILVSGVPLAATASDSAAPESAPAPTGWVHQIGTYDYLVQPDFDGLAPLRTGLRQVTIGLGTFDRLNGELVIIGGTAYRVGTDGTPRPASLKRTTPFLQSVRFSPQRSLRLAPGTECSALGPLIDELATSPQGMVAVRLVGDFTTLTARSVPAQSRPYPPLADVVADQTVFPLTGVRATLVGFRTGPDVLGIGAPGVHLHGLTAARDAGGHILGCTTGADVRLSIQRTRGVRVLTTP